MTMMSLKRPPSSGGNAPEHALNEVLVLERDDEEADLRS